MLEVGKDPKELSLEWGDSDKKPQFGQVVYSLLIQEESGARC